MEIKNSGTPLVEFPKDEMFKLIHRFTPERIATFLDVTDLKADTLGPKLDKMANWAISLNCASVCVNPVEVDRLPLLLKGSGVAETYVMDFPLGKVDIDLKAKMTEDTVKKSRQLRGEGKGHIDIDIVINVGRFKTDPSYTLNEINAMCEAAEGEVVKVIVRSSELTEEEVYKVSEVVANSKAQFIKNSTGMDAYGAMPEHMRIMREVVGSKKGVKAAGGISDAMTAMRLIYAGAREESLQTPELFRIGTSGPLNIVSSMGWLRHNTEDWLDAGIIPCLVCPYHYTSKLRSELRVLSQKKCQGCKHFHYRKNKDF
ncbi:MAG: deoxyribose-phosphate aldolase [Bacteroidetes bacterium GWF2_33_16]|nr:MAG: deoxyribose-phosphate aldolase [Bacteroidetes bacterium GWE2_32_14]OFY03456.1 MAG: deoxyribose-phosphate aldolase [Bacteroidetes bacterium GWF2_33_16]